MYQTEPMLHPSSQERIHTIPSGLDKSMSAVAERIPTKWSKPSLEYFERRMRERFILVLSLFKKRTVLDFLGKASLEVPGHEVQPRTCAVRESSHQTGHSERLTHSLSSFIEHKTNSQEIQLQWHNYQHTQNTP